MGAHLQTALTLVDEMERLAHAGELSPERFDALTSRIGDHCKLVVLSSREDVLRANTLETAALIDIAATALLRLQVLHCVDLLKPKEFDTGVAQARAALTRAAAIADPETEALDPPAPPLAGLPLCRMRFVQDGRRQFGVIEGGRA